MRSRLEAKLDEWTPWIYLGLLMTMTVAMAVILVFIFQQHNSISSQQRKINAQTTRVAILSQTLCQRINRSRVNNNNQVRRPLKATTQAIANLLKQSIPNAQTPTQKAALIDLSSQFQRYADRVTITKQTPCKFTQNQGGGK